MFLLKKKKKTIKIFAFFSAIYELCGAYFDVCQVHAIFSRTSETDIQLTIFFEEGVVSDKMKTCRRILK